MTNKQVEKMKSMQRLMADMFREEWGKPEYSRAASMYTPEEFSAIIVDGLRKGTASKDGPIVKRCLSALGIKHTYKAIKEWFNV
jgi:hypothetical protein